MTPRPGEITLAHRGVLFLDELPEFQRRSLEALREPLEEGEITIARSQATLRFPAEFLLVAAMNPCPCGFLGHARRRCHCTPDRIRRYGEKVSGPLLDRIDIRLAVESPAGARLLRSRSSQGPGTRELLALVEIATGFRRSQGRALPSRRLSWSSRDRWAPLDARCRALLEGAADSADLSTRGLTRVLRVARTVADMDRSASVEERHVLEALEYRSPSGGDGLFAYLENR